MTKLSVALVLLATYFSTLIFAQQSLVVVIDENKLSKPILDSSRLIEHIKNNQQVKNYMIDVSQADEETTTVAKKLLQRANVDAGKLSSFVTQFKELNKTLQPIFNQIQQVSASQLVELMTKFPNSVILFTNKSRQSRLLQETQQQTSPPSQLFLNMTPQVLSGLFVALFLIVMLLIAVSCLFDIKTNDKFATNNLFVGKES